MRAALYHLPSDPICRWHWRRLLGRWRGRNCPICWAARQRLRDQPP
jgi:hypothetical protein